MNKKVFTLFVDDYNNAQDLTDNNDDVTKISPAFEYNKFCKNTIKTCLKMTPWQILHQLDLLG